MIKKLYLCLAFMLSTLPVYADSCSSVISGAQMGPAPSFNKWRWGNACYIVWEGGYINGKNARFTYEPKCEQILGYLHFEGDFGSNRNVCVFEPSKNEDKNQKITANENINEIDHYSSIVNNKPKPVIFTWLNEKNNILSSVSRSLFEYDFAIASKLLDTYTVISAKERSFDGSQEQMNMILGLSQEDRESYLKAKSEQSSRSVCLSRLRYLLGHSGEKGLINAAFSLLDEYEQECRSHNYYGLNSVYQTLRYRFSDIKERIATRKDAFIEPEFIGNMSADNCRVMGGVPDSTITSPKDTDPPRGCTRHYFKDKRASQFRPRGKGICPDGTPVSSTGVCPAN